MSMPVLLSPSHAATMLKFHPGSCGQNDFPRSCGPLPRGASGVSTALQCLRMSRKSNRGERVSSLGQQPPTPMAHLEKPTVMCKHACGVTPLEYYAPASYQRRGRLSWVMPMDLRRRQIRLPDGLRRGAAMPRRSNQRSLRYSQRRRLRPQDPPGLAAPATSPSGFFFTERFKIPAQAPSLTLARSQQMHFEPRGGDRARLASRSSGDAKIHNSS